MCLPACLWAQITRNPFQYTITPRMLLANCDAVDFRGRFFSFQHWEKLCYRKDVHHNPMINYATRCLEKRKWLHVLWDKLFPEVRTNREESMKTWRWKSTMTKQIAPSAVELLPFYLWACLYLTFAVGCAKILQARGTTEEH